MKHTFTNKLTNAVAPAAPASMWCKAVPGKGGKTTNASASEKKSDKEKEND